MTPGPPLPCRVAPELPWRPTCAAHNSPNLPAQPITTQFPTASASAAASTSTSTISAALRCLATAACLHPPARVVGTRSNVQRLTTHPCVSRTTSGTHHRPSAASIPQNLPFCSLRRPKHTHNGSGTHLSKSVIKSYHPATPPHNNHSSRPACYYYSYCRSRKTAP